MEATRIDEKLQFHHLIQIVTRLDLAMGEYFGLLSAIVARNGCRDGDACAQKGFSGPVGYIAKMLNPVMFNNTPLCPSRNYMLRLDHLGIKPDEFFGSDEYLIPCQDGIEGMPLKITGGTYAARDFGAQFFAFKWTPHSEDDGESIEDLPALNHPIEQIVSLDQGIGPPEDFYISPAIVIPAEQYDVWEHSIKEVVNYLLMVLQPLFPQPLLLPDYNHRNIWLPHDGRIKLS